MDVLKLKQEYELLRSDRAANEDPVWDEIERYIMPLTGKTAQALYATTPQAKTDTVLWDLTAPLALEHLASSLHGDITSPASQWLGLEWQDEELEKDHEARKHREDIANQIWSELQASDFNMEISSGYPEWAGLGNTCLVCEPTVRDLTSWDGLDFTCVPVRQVQFVEDSRGGLLRWYRHLRWTLTQIIDHCEREKVPPPQRLVELAKQPSAASTKVDVIFAIYRREDVKAPVSSDMNQTPENRPWGCCYFTLDQAEMLGEEGGYYVMPVVMGRFAKRPGTQWGYGRGHVSLRSVKGINYLKEMHFKAAEKAIDPAYGMSERMAGAKIDLSPGKGNLMHDKDSWWPLESAARFDVSVDILNREGVEIRRAFHEDDLQLKESPQMTATEVQARKDQMNRALGSPVGRLQTDVLAPIVMIVLDLLKRAKRIPPAPASVKQRKGELKLRFRGPIARAQLMDEVVAIEREAAFISNLLQLGFTEARYHFNLGNAIREHSKRLGVPAAVLNSEAEAKKGVDDERRMMAEAQAAKTAKDQGQALAAAAGAVQAAGPAAPGIGEQPALSPSGGVIA